ERIHSSGNHLLGLINGILDLSRIEAGKMTLALEHFDIRGVINDVVATVAPIVQKNANQIVVHCPDDSGAVHSDLLKTRQILLNLIGNAAKFTRNGTITLDVARRIEGQTPSIAIVV